MALLAARQPASRIWPPSEIDADRRS